MSYDWFDNQTADLTLGGKGKRGTSCITCKLVSGLVARALAGEICKGPDARPEPPADAIVVNATGSYSNSVKTALADETCKGPNARTEPPAGAIAVDATGSYSNSVKTVSEGVAKLNPNTASVQTIFVRPGVYHEQVLVLPLSGPLVLQGFTCDARSYASNEVIITHAKAQKDIPIEITGEARNDLTSTVRFKTDNVKVYNLNIANTAGNVGQALAVNVNATNYGFYACNLSGHQDTLLANDGLQIYAQTLVQGTVDFIFGRYARVWFESCDIETIGRGCITANGRDSESNPSFFVFNRAHVFGTSGANSTDLGRPWRPYARVVFENSKLDDVVKPDGWSKWNATSNTEHVFFGEFNNTGAGAATAKRIAFSKQLDAPVTIEEILGDEYKTEWWVDTSYL